MSTWVLILFMFDASPKLVTDVQTVQVDGFQTRVACERAGKSLLDAYDKLGKAVCVEQPSPNVITFR